MLRVSFRKRFDGFNLDVEFASTGSITALFAPSGAGKSLTLQAIAGLVSPDEGIIEVCGRVFFDSCRGINIPASKRMVGFLFQDYALFPHMTVEKNILYGSKDVAFANELMRIFGISDIRRRYPFEISGGQKQRVAFARALALKPSVLLLDEPFSAIHKSLKQSLYDEVKRVRDMFNIPIVIVTHDIDEVFELADFMVVMDSGRVVQCGTPADVFMNPCSLSVARLLGHRTFLYGRVKRIDDVCVYIDLCRGVMVKSKCSIFKNLRVGDKVAVSIMPFSMALSPFEESSRVSVNVLSIDRREGYIKLILLMCGEHVELHIPGSLFPNFILEEGRETQIYISASNLPVIPLGREVYNETGLYG